jgi:hypothetical protein
VIIDLKWMFFLKIMKAPAHKRRRFFGLKSLMGFSKREVWTKLLLLKIVPLRFQLGGYP